MTEGVANIRRLGYDPNGRQSFAPARETGFGPQRTIVLHWPSDGFAPCISEYPEDPTQLRYGYVRRDVVEEVARVVAGGDASKALDTLRAVLGERACTK